MSIYRWNVERL